MKRFFKHYFLFIFAVLILMSCSFDLDNSNLSSPNGTFSFSNNLMGVAATNINTSSDNLVNDLSSLNCDAPDSMTSGMYLSHIVYEANNTKSSGSYYDITSETELWLMPTERGHDEPIASSNVENIKTYLPNEDGEFIIPEADYPDSTFAIFVMNKAEDGTYSVLGMLSLETDDGNYVTEFPCCDEIDGVISFGYASLDDASYIINAKNKLQENEGSFTPEIFEELNNDTLIHNAGLMALNTLLNSHEDCRYIPKVKVYYFYNSETTIEDSDDIDWQGYEVQIYSDDCTSELGFFKPDGTQIGEYTSSYGENSSAKWSWIISKNDFKEQATARNLWTLRTRGNEIVAELDLSVMILSDNNNNPIIPLIDPTYATKTNTNGEDIIDTLFYNWYYFGPDGTTKHLLNDAEQLDRLIAKNEFWLQTTSSDDESIVTYMFRGPSPTNLKCGGMEGDLTFIYNISPEIKVDNFFINMGHQFSLNGIEAFDCNKISMD